MPGAIAGHQDAGGLQRPIAQESLGTTPQAPGSSTPQLAGGSLGCVTQPEAVKPMSPEAFLAWERQQAERHVYLHGQVFAMAGGSPRHSLLASRIITNVGTLLRGKPCDVHSPDLRLGLDATHLVYADAVVACRPLLLKPGTSDVVLNPRVVFELLSKSTESYDRGEKQAGYLALPSLEHFVLVSQREPRIEVYTREGAGSFHYQVFGPGSTIDLSGIEVAIEVDALYESAFELPGDEAESAPATVA